MDEPLIFERSRPGSQEYRLPQTGIPEDDISTIVPHNLRRQAEPRLPDVAEPEVVRHFTRLSHRNHAIDLGFYPLGSCTMKYNPKVNDSAAVRPSFESVHPLQPVSSVQGTLEIMHRCLSLLSRLTGMSWGTLQPFAGAHGEFTGMKLFRAYFDKTGQGNRNVILVPDSAHGTNPASANIAGFKVREIPSDENGIVSTAALQPHLNDELAGIMLTNPNTLGLFERNILDISAMVHDAGGLLYYDGANLNAVVGRCRPGDMGFDVVHVNLHKTFSTPHGGGGPGSGPVLVAEKLVPFLPVPDVVRGQDGYGLEYDRPDSIGKVAGFHGNVGVVIRALAYILIMGREGLRTVSEAAVLNANYLKELLKNVIPVAYDAVCKHEFVLTARLLKEEYGVSAMDIAKRLLDYGIHPPTVYFPINVAESLMIEPTETETRETLDEFARIMREIVETGQSDPDALHNAPQHTAVKRVDEVRAARHPVLSWRPERSEDSE